MRTEELNGMQLAIKILSSEGAKKTFESSTTTFLQLAAVRKHTDRSSVSSKAYNQLKVVATQFRNRNVAKIAVELQSGGHFDKVITMIDDMVGLLRKEEQDDIEHRDRCENAQNANGNELADLKSEIKKTEASIKRMENTETDLQGQISALKTEISATNSDMKDMLDLRNKESTAFKNALKDDTDAAALLKKAIGALSSYYTRNKMPVPQLIQKAPEYAKDADKAPDATFASNDSRKSESGGIIAILEMLVEDTEKEMKEGRADDADAQEQYLKQNGALQDTLDSQEETKANTETELADLQEKIADYEKHSAAKAGDQSATEDEEKGLGTDCAWVKTHFQTRRDKRKDEIQGLVDAKSFLASGGSGII
jgi:predicted  nucleic acid-binding Zn-ribbon protein